MNDTKPSAGRHYRTGLQASIRNNTTAYGFSIMITASYGALASIGGEPTVVDVLLFVFGAILAFVGIEAVVSAGFRRHVAEEPPEVVALGTALSFVSAGVAVGTAALCGEVLSDQLAWPVGAFTATAAYILISAAEMAAAERLKGR